MCKVASRYGEGADVFLFCFINAAVIRTLLLSVGRGILIHAAAVVVTFIASLASHSRLHHNTTLGKSLGGRSVQTGGPLPWPILAGQIPDENRDADGRGT